MNKLKVMSIFGTRPEATKMAPLVLALEACDQIESILCVTAQHREMLDSVLEIFKLKPDYDLNIMEKKQSLTTITVNALKGLDEVLDEAKPDLVLVHGDTSTTFVGALAAFYKQIFVGHVEAGLRSYDRYSPFPEEINRRLVAPIASLHFAPTQKNIDNLKREGISEGIYGTGNTAIDAVRLVAKEGYVFTAENDWLNHIDYQNKKIIFMTAHRRENYGEGLHAIMRAVKRVADEFPEVLVIYPMHLSPTVRETAREVLEGVKNVLLCDPLPFHDNLNLISRCTLVLTDSGGIQEEAPALGKPVLVLRRETERPEAVYAGTARMAGVDEETIYAMTRTLLTDAAEYERMAKAVNPYGDGRASERIVAAILHHFGRGEAPESFNNAVV